MFDEARHARSATVEINDILANDEIDGSACDVLLFKDPQTDSEIPYSTDAELFRRNLMEAGYGDIASILHRYRTRGATAFAYADKGGMLVATSMGGWSKYLVVSRAYRGGKRSSGLDHWAQYFR